MFWSCFGLVLSWFQAFPEPLTIVFLYSSAALATPYHINNKHLGVSACKISIHYRTCSFWYVECWMYINIFFLLWLLIPCRNIIVSDSWCPTFYSIPELKNTITLVTPSELFLFSSPLNGKAGTTEQCELFIEVVLKSKQ